MEKKSTKLLTTIYDLGANDGANLPYYLSRAEKVVAVEANPQLVGHIEEVFALEIASSRLRLIHCALSDSASDGIPFYIHRRDHHISQVDPPPTERLHEYEITQLESRSIVDIVNDEGFPDFIKIDLEGYDGRVLQQLFQAGIYPPSLSAECHTTMPFSLIELTGLYRSYQLMDARYFSVLPVPRLDLSVTGTRDFSFHEGTAGPFGSDIPGPWMNSRQFLMNLAIAGLGWRDLHARMDPPDCQARVWMEHLPVRALVGGMLRKALRHGASSFALTTGSRV
ncbi:FkbM family methyltransferase [Synechococcus sp. 1G10]|uniref:FkbM family methyltransferase n=1 Tax=Synechococcus sp. 1G10 TaxID=2025605 RepID=UPI000B9944B2|nr:FkbM family methyltransferase [Synechococcus sp. 1G10]